MTTRNIMATKLEAERGFESVAEEVVDDLCRSHASNAAGCVPLSTDALVTSRTGSSYIASGVTFALDPSSIQCHNGASHNPYFLSPSPPFAKVFGDKDPWAKKREYGGRFRSGLGHQQGNVKLLVDGHHLVGKSYREPQEGSELLSPRREARHNKQVVQYLPQGMTAEEPCLQNQQRDGEEMQGDCEPLRTSCCSSRRGFSPCFSVEERFSEKKNSTWISPADFAEALQPDAALASRWEANGARNDAALELGAVLASGAPPGPRLSRVESVFVEDDDKSLPTSLLKTEATQKERACVVSTQEAIKETAFRTAQNQSARTAAAAIEDTVPNPSGYCTASAASSTRTQNAETRFSAASACTGRSRSVTALVGLSEESYTTAPAVSSASGERWSERQRQERMSLPAESVNSTQETSAMSNTSKRSARSNMGGRVRSRLSSMEGTVNSFLGVESDPPLTSTTFTCASTFSPNAIPVCRTSADNYTTVVAVDLVSNASTAPSRAGSANFVGSKVSTATEKSIPCSSLSAATEQRLGGSMTPQRILLRSAAKATSTRRLCMNNNSPLSAEVPEASFAPLSVCHSGASGSFFCLKRSAMLSNFAAEDALAENAQKGMTSSEFNSGRDDAAVCRTREKCSALASLRHANLQSDLPGDNGAAFSDTSAAFKSVKGGNWAPLELNSLVRACPRPLLMAAEDDRNWKGVFGTTMTRFHSPRKILCSEHLGGTAATHSRSSQIFPNTQPRAGTLVSSLQNAAAAESGCQSTGSLGAPQKHLENDSCLQQNFESSVHANVHEKSNSAGLPSLCPTPQVSSNTPSSQYIGELFISAERQPQENTVSSSRWTAPSLAVKDCISTKPANTHTWQESPYQVLRSSLQDNVSSISRGCVTRLCDTDAVSESPASADAFQAHAPQIQEKASHEGRSAFAIDTPHSYYFYGGENSGVLQAFKPISVSPPTEIILPHTLALDKSPNSAGQMKATSLQQGVCLPSVSALSAPDKFSSGLCENYQLSSSSALTGVFGDFEGHNVGLLGASPANSSPQKQSVNAALSTWPPNSRESFSAKRVPLLSSADPVQQKQSVSACSIAGPRDREACGSTSLSWKLPAEQRFPAPLTGLTTAWANGSERENKHTSVSLRCQPRSAASSHHWSVYAWHRPTVAQRISTSPCVFPKQTADCAPHPCKSIVPARRAYATLSATLRGRDALIKEGNFRRGQWSKAEDATLRQFFEVFHLKWAAIAAHLTATFGILRTGKQCRERWCNHVNPAVKKGGWTSDEDAHILHLQSQMGNRWAAIAKELPGRTENAVKNRYISLSNCRGAGRVSCYNRAANANYNVRSVRDSAAESLLRRSKIGNTCSQLNKPAEGINKASAHISSAEGNSIGMNYAKAFMKNHSCGPDKEALRRVSQGSNKGEEREIVGRGVSRNSAYNLHDGQKAAATEDAAGLVQKGEVMKEKEGGMKQAAGDGSRYSMDSVFGKGQGNSEGNAQRPVQQVQRTPQIGSQGVEKCAASVKTQCASTRGFGCNSTGGVEVGATCCDRRHMDKSCSTVNPSQRARVARCPRAVSLRDRHLQHTATSASSDVKTLHVRKRRRPEDETAENCLLFASAPGVRGKEGRSKKRMSRVPAREDPSRKPIVRALADLQNPKFIGEKCAIMNLALPRAERVRQATVAASRSTGRRALLESTTQKSPLSQGTCSNCTGDCTCIIGGSNALLSTGNFSYPSKNHRAGTKPLPNARWGNALRQEAVQEQVEVEADQQERLTQWRSLPVSEHERSASFYDTSRNPPVPKSASPVFLIAQAERQHLSDATAARGGELLIGSKMGPGWLGERGLRTRNEQHSSLKQMAIIQSVSQSQVLTSGWKDARTAKKAQPVVTQFLQPLPISKFSLLHQGENVGGRRTQQQEQEVSSQQIEAQQDCQGIECVAAPPSGSRERCLAECVPQRERQVSPVPIPQQDEEARRGSSLNTTVNAGSCNGLGKKALKGCTCTRHEEQRQMESPREKQQRLEPYTQSLYSEHELPQWKNLKKDYKRGDESEGLSQQLGGAEEQMGDVQRHADNFQKRNGKQEFRSCFVVKSRSSHELKSFSPSQADKGNMSQRFYGRRSTAIASYSAADVKEADFISHTVVGQGFTNGVPLERASAVAVGHQPTEKESSSNLPRRRRCFSRSSLEKMPRKPALRLVSTATNSSFHSVLQTGTLKGVSSSIIRSAYLAKSSACSMTRPLPDIGTAEHNPSAASLNSANLCVNKDRLQFHSSGIKGTLQDSLPNLSTSSHSGSSEAQPKSLTFTQERCQSPAVSPEYFDKGIQNCLPYVALNENNEVERLSRPQTLQPQQLQQQLEQNQQSYEQVLPELQSETSEGSTPPCTTAKSSNFSLKHCHCHGEGLQTFRYFPGATSLANEQRVDYPSSSSFLGDARVTDIQLWNNISAGSSRIGERCDSGVLARKAASDLDPVHRPAVVGELTGGEAASVVQSDAGELFAGFCPKLASEEALNTTKRAAGVSAAALVDTVPGGRTNDIMTPLFRQGHLTGELCSMQRQDRQQHQVPITGSAFEQKGWHMKAAQAYDRCPPSKGKWTFAEVSTLQETVPLESHYPSSKQPGSENHAGRDSVVQSPGPGAAGSLSSKEDFVAGKPTPPLQNDLRACDPTVYRQDANLSPKSVLQQAAKQASFCKNSRESYRRDSSTGRFKEDALQQRRHVQETCLQLPSSTETSSLDLQEEQQLPGFCSARSPTKKETMTPVEELSTSKCSAPNKTEAEVHTQIGQAVATNSRTNSKVAYDEEKQDCEHCLQELQCQRERQEQCSPCQETQGWLLEDRFLRTRTAEIGEEEKGVFENEQLAAQKHLRLGIAHDNQRDFLFQDVQEFGNASSNLSCQEFLRHPLLDHALPLPLGAESIFGMHTFTGYMQLC